MNAYRTNFEWWLNYYLLFHTTFLPILIVYDSETYFSYCITDLVFSFFSFLVFLIIRFALSFSSYSESCSKLHQNMFLDDKEYIFCYGYIMIYLSNKYIKIIFVSVITVYLFWGSYMWFVYSLHEYLTPLDPDASLPSGSPKYRY